MYLYADLRRTAAGETHDEVPAPSTKKNVATEAKEDSMATKKSKPTQPKAKEDNKIMKALKKEFGWREIIVNFFGRSRCRYSPTGCLG